MAKSVTREHGENKQKFVSGVNEMAVGKFFITMVPTLFGL